MGGGWRAWTIAHKVYRSFSVTLHWLSVLNLAYSTYQALKISRWLTWIAYVIQSGVEEFRLILPFYWIDILQSNRVASPEKERIESETPECSVRISYTPNGKTWKIKQATITLFLQMYLPSQYLLTNALRDMRETVVVKSSRSIKLIFFLPKKKRKLRSQNDQECIKQ